MRVRAIISQVSPVRYDWLDTALLAAPCVTLEMTRGRDSRHGYAFLRRPDPT